MTSGFMGLCLKALLLGVILVHQTSSQINFPQPSGGGGGSPFGGGKPAFQSSRPTTTNADKTTTVSSQGQTNSCNCLARSACPQGKGQAKHGCITEQKQEGICCTDQPNTVMTRTGLFGSTSAVNIPSNIVQQGIQFGQQASSQIEQQNRRLKQSGQYLAKKTASRAHAYFFDRRESTKSQNKEAYRIAKASAEIARMQKLSPGQVTKSLQNIDTGSQTRSGCRREQRPRCDPSSRYRTIDGTCNNLRDVNLGKSDTALSRLGNALYDDGVMAPRTRSVDLSPLKNVREISNTVLLDVNNPSPEISLNVMQWAQFVDHDLTHVPFEDMDGEAIMCCERGKIVRNPPEQCFPISVSPFDGFFRQFGEQCINFVRSMLALRPQCSLGPAEQVNALTHWLDGSMIYGSTEEEARAVRQGNTAFLKMSRGTRLLPTDPTLDCEARVQAPCFVAGDSRSNEQPGLTAMHTFWVREHNRIANQLQQLNPRASQEVLFQEARRIVVAQVQHITYTEWLPIIVGPEAFRRYNLGRTNYDPSIDPSQFNEFATAAFRFGHSLVQGVFLLPSETGRITSLRLRDAFNNPGIFQKDPELLNSFVRSLVSQPSQNLDSFITEDLSNHLFEIRGTQFGMDLMSLNLQRGRDHGISTYAEMRRRFNIGRTNNFADLQTTTPEDLIIRLQTVYQFVDDIDLFAGGMTERPVAQGLLGPTFANIVALQFSNLRNGDRFFYDLPNQPGSFTPAQIAEIRKSSMARLLCDNSDVKKMQRNAFLIASRNNPKLDCSQIEGINLRAWS